jgi:hypothetical protein
MLFLQGHGETQRRLEFDYTIMDFGGLLKWARQHRELVNVLEHYVSDARGKSIHMYDLTCEALETAEQGTSVYFLVSTLHHDPLLRPKSKRQDIGNILRITYNPENRVAVLGGIVYTNGKFRCQGLCSTTLTILLGILRNQVINEPFDCHIRVMKTNQAAISAFQASGAEPLLEGDVDTILKINV